MGYNQKMFGLGSKRSIIREIFEYSKTRAAEIGAENVYDFSLGNPSVPAPADVNDTIRELMDTQNSVLLHGYTSAQGDAGVRKVIADRINERFDVDISPNLIYMTCGAAASLSHTPQCNLASYQLDSKGYPLNPQGHCYSKVYSYAIYK